MSVITIPAGLDVSECSIGQARYDLLESSDSTGSDAARLLGPPRWKMRLAGKQAYRMADAGVWEALLLQLRGRVNHLAAHDPVRTVPQGTMRGSMTLNGNHAAGVAVLSITATPLQAAKTLLRGDWLQLGTGLGTSQLVKVVADAVSNGSGFISVTVEPPLRRAFVNGVAIAWDKPVAYYKQTSEPSWTYRPPSRVGGFAIDLLESFG